MSLLWSTEDGLFRVRFSAGAMRRLLRLADEGGRRETGGVLIGCYTADHTTAVVTRVGGPPPDSRRGRTWFARGVAGLRRHLLRLWRRPAAKRRYYLGEWHFHPGAAPEPSAQDRRQMRQLAAGGYHCPEPILVIVGGRRDEWRIGISVFPNGRAERVLKPVEGGS